MDFKMASDIDVCQIHVEPIPELPILHEFLWIFKTLEAAILNFKIGNRFSPSIHRVRSKNIYTEWFQIPEVAILDCLEILTMIHNFQKFVECRESLCEFMTFSENLEIIREIQHGTAYDEKFDMEQYDLQGIGQLMRRKSRESLDLSALQSHQRFFKSK